jgi:TetR/AcrR family transcriptional regulator, mexJK operon transcriptional repressor
MSSAPRRPDEGRSARKRRAIIEAATEVFLDHGYRGASMDAIAARAQVSKQTVYKHFSDKESLFSAIVRSAVDAAADPVFDEVRRLPDTGDVEADLRHLARQLVARVMAPAILRLRRLVIGEAARFPELGHAFHEQGPARTIEALAAAFERLASRGALELDDPALAAAHFNWLVLATPLNRAMLLGEDEPPPAAALRRYADDGVRAFLRAYGAAPVRGPSPDRRRRAAQRSRRAR